MNRKEILTELDSFCNDECVSAETVSIIAHIAVLTNSKIPNDTLLLLLNNIGGIHRDSLTPSSVKLVKLINQIVKDGIDDE